MVKPSQQLMTKVVVAGVCASDKQHERAVAVPVVKKKEDFSGYTCSVGISDIHSEGELH